GPPVPRVFTPATEETRAPDLHVRVYRNVSATGNAASESWRRWLHLVAENWSPSSAKDAKVNLRVRTETDRGSWREWYWTDARQIAEIVQGTPIAIPIVLGDVAPPPRNIVG